MNTSHHYKFIEQHHNKSHSKKIMVIGDFMLDLYLMGNSERISPEAPVPVVRFEREVVRLGGSGNVVANLCGLGFEVLPFGIIGKDDNGQKIRELLTKFGCDDQTILELEDHVSTSKTRVVSQFQQIVRVDRESVLVEKRVLLDQLWPRIEESFETGSVSACIISDYDKGVCHPLLIEKIIKLARVRGIPVLVDPKKDNASVYKGATYVVPNSKEFSRWVPRSERDVDMLINMAQDLKKELEVDNLLITRGADGMILLTADGSVFRIGAETKDVFDVSGAGDTVISVLAAGVVWGLSSEEASRLSNTAAGIVVGKFGISPIHIDELKQAVCQQYHNRKVVTLEELTLSLSRWRALEKRIVFTNGCFDLLHVGHINLLRQAKSLGNILVVGLNTDASVARLKGSERPINSEQERALILAELEAVDAIVLFDTDTPITLIETIQPDILVKGSDYVDKEIVGQEIVENTGGEVYLIPAIAGYSTTNLIKRIKGG